MNQNEITIEELMTDKLPVDHSFPQIIQINLPDFNYEYPEAEGSWNILREIYAKVLHRDPLWHFFFEAYDSILRISAEFQPEVLAILETHKVLYTVVGPWVDNNEHTAKYHRIFTYLFHGFSELAMITPDGYSQEFCHIADRVIHCYLDHQWYKIPDYRKKNGEYLWESIFMMSQALSRIRYNYGDVNPFWERKNDT